MNFSPTWARTRHVRIAKPTRARRSIRPGAGSTVAGRAVRRRPPCHRLAGLPEPETAHSARRGAAAWS